MTDTIGALVCVHLSSLSIRDFKQQQHRAQVVWCQQKIYLLAKIYIHYCSHGYQEEQVIKPALLLFPAAFHTGAIAQLAGNLKAALMPGGSHVL